jgi:hypothetical protein
MRILLSSFLIIALIAACSTDDRPDKLLAEDTYVDLLIEMQLLRTYQTHYQQTDSLNIDSLRTEIFKKHETTETIFRQSHTYYQQEIEEQSERIKKAIENLRKDKLQPQDSSATEDSLNTE